jgi:nitroreductase
VPQPSGIVSGVEFRDVVRRRHMVRDYDPDRPVPPDIRDRILEHALHAPSAGFSQGWAFLVLEEPADRALFWQVTASDEDRATMDDWLRRMQRAPLIVVPLSHKAGYLRRYAEPDKGWTDQDETRWPVPYWDIDTGMAALLMLLTVTDEGLAACFSGIQPEQHPCFREAFGIPAEYTAIGALTIGYEGSEDRRSPSLQRGRRGLDEVVHRGRW